MDLVKLFSVRTDLRAGKLTIYGTNECSWTQKQIEYLKEKGISFDFVDCAAGKCPDFVSGYPTLDQDGKIISGFTKI